MTPVFIDNPTSPCNHCKHALNGQIHPLKTVETHSDKGQPGDLIPGCCEQNLSSLGHWQGHNAENFPEGLLPLRLFKCRENFWLVIPGIYEDQPGEIRQSHGLNGGTCHDDWGGWDGFLVSCEIRDQHDGVIYYGKTNCNYIRFPNGAVLENYGYHGKNVMSEIREHGWVTVYNRFVNIYNNINTITDQPLLTPIPN